MLNDFGFKIKIPKKKPPKSNKKDEPKTCANCEKYLNCLILNHQRTISCWRKEKGLGNYGT